MLSADGDEEVTVELYQHRAGAVSIPLTAGTREGSSGPTRSSSVIGRIGVKRDGNLDAVDKDSQSLWSTLTSCFGCLKSRNMNQSEFQLVQFDDAGNKSYSSNSTSDN